MHHFILESVKNMFALHVKQIDLVLMKYNIFLRLKSYFIIFRPCVFALIAHNELNLLVWSTATMHFPFEIKLHVSLGATNVCFDRLAMLAGFDT